MRYKFLIVILTAIPSFITGFAHSQPSLSADDTKELVIEYSGKKESFTLLRDATNRSQWYYVPNEPRLTEKIINGVANPELTLLRYQFVDPGSQGHSFDGGILQFAVNLSPDENGLTALKAALKSELDAAVGGSPANLSLAPLPLKSAQASIYTLGGGDSSRLISKSFGTGLFPTFASQKAPFVLYLTKWGADINDALIGNSVSSNTGVPVAVTLTYQGLTPPAHLRIKANYSKIFDHYSQDKTFAAKVSYFGLFGASTQMRWSTINERLSANGALIVEKITNEEISDENMNKVMQDVMKRINDQILQILSPPPSIPPASADMPSFNDRFGGVGYNVSTKNVHFDASFVDEFTWDERKLVVRSTLAGGFIGLGKYPQEIRNRAVQFVPSFDWDMAYFVLPDIGLLSQLQQVQISTELKNAEAHVSTQSGKWTPTKGWRKLPDDRDSISTLDFSITDLLHNGVNRNNLKFITTTTVLQAGRQTILKDTQNVVQGSIPIAPPSEGLSTIVFDPADLQFKNINTSAGRLLRVSVSLKVKDKIYSDVIQPKLDNAQYKFPNALVWVVKNEDLASGAIKATLKFDYTSGSTPLTKTIVIDDFLKEAGDGLNLLIRDPIGNN
jgi:hypothetical protein